MLRRSTRRVVLGVFLCVALSFLILPAQPADANPSPWRDKSSPFGMATATANRVRTDEIGTYVQLLREAGVQWTREEIFWDQVQFEPGGPFRWKGDEGGLYDYDTSINTLAANGINMLGLLNYNPAWFKGQNPPLDAWIDDWGNYVYQTVARYGRSGAIKHWEIWNEPNLTTSGYESGLYTIEHYIRVLGTARDAAKAADPEATIVLGGLVSVWSYPPSPTTYDYFDYLDRVGQLGGWGLFDIVAIHPYRPDAPEGAPWRRDNQQTFADEMNRLDSLIARYGAKPVWLTEMGWASNSVGLGVGEDQQAQFLARLYIMALAHPSIEKIFWYGFRDDTIPGAQYDQPVYDSTFHELHFGLIRRTFPLDANQPNLRKPSFLAYRAMTTELRGLTLQEVIANGARADMPATYWYRFGGNRRVDVMWNTDTSYQTVQIPCDCREALVRHWNGRARYVIYPENGVLNLQLDEQGSPVYVEYDTPPLGDEFFPLTGHSIGGAFQAFWRANGGLDRFGYPITEEIIEPDSVTGIPRSVQYFERARFEYFPELAGTPHAVQLGLLGETILARFGIDWNALPKVEGAPPECQFFPETGHSICPPFLQRWQALGGVELMGQPITEPFETQRPNSDQLYTVQYFQRARLEYFSEFAGTPNEVQLGLLGREQLTRWQGP
ncbi:MAG: glycosyl hydrolase [Chloroflexota bacterium]